MHRLALALIVSCITFSSLLSGLRAPTLQDLREAKANLVAKSKDLENAREMLLSLKSLEIGDLDTFVAKENQSIVNNSLISEEDRARLSEDIVSLVCRVKLSYRELQLHIVEQLQTIYTSVQNGQVQAAFDSLHRLQQVASAQPGNMASVAALQNGIGKALSSALGEQLSRELKGSNQKPKSPEAKAAAAAAAAAPAVASSNPPSTGLSSPVASAEKLTYSVEEVQHLLSQNETMRGTIAQLRQRLAQTKASEAAGQAGAGRRSSVYGKKVAAKGATSSTTPAISPSALPAAAATSSEAPAEQPVEEKAYYPFLYEFMGSYLSPGPDGFLAQTLSAHPLYPNPLTNGDSITGILDLLLGEVRESALGLVGAIFVDLLHSDPAFLAALESYGGVEDTGFFRRPDLVELLHNTAMQCIGLAVVHDEVFNLGTLYLSYVHGLFELDVMPAEEQQQQASEMDQYHQSSSAYEAHGGSSSQNGSSHGHTASKASLFRARNVNATTAPSPAPAASTHASIEHNLFDQSASLNHAAHNRKDKLPRYMQHSKSYASKVTTKSPRTPAKQ